LHGKLIPDPNRNQAEIERKSYNTDLAVQQWKCLQTYRPLHSKNTIYLATILLLLKRL